MRRCSGSLSSLHNAPRQGAAGAGPTAASVHDPRSLWAALAGALRSTLRWPRPAVPVRAAADDLLGQRRLPRRPQPLLGRQGQPCDRPASTIAGLQGAPGNGNEGFKRRGSSKRGSWISTGLKVGAPGRAWSIPR